MIMTFIEFYTVIQVFMTLIIFARSHPCLKVKKGIWASSISSFPVEIKLFKILSQILFKVRPLKLCVIIISLELYMFIPVTMMNWIHFLGYKKGWRHNDIFTGLFCMWTHLAFAFLVLFCCCVVRFVVFLWISVQWIDICMHNQWLIVTICVAFILLYISHCCVLMKY